MQNLTQHYSDEYLRNCIAKVGGNHNKCTASIQFSISDHNWYLCIYQDYSTGWDCDERVIYSEPANELEVAEHIDELPF